MKRCGAALATMVLALAVTAQTPAQTGSRVLLNGKWGLVSSAGKILIEPTLDLIYNYRNGYTVAVRGDKRAYVDTRGAVITDFAFDSAYHFFNDLAPVQLAGKYGLVDKSGKLVVGFSLGYPTDLGSFYLAQSDTAGARVVINGRGEVIARVDADYWGGDWGATDQVVVKQGGKMGVIDVTGAVVIPAEYTTLARVHGDTYVGTRDQGVTRVLSRAGATLYQTTGGQRLTDWYRGYSVTYDGAKRVFTLSDNAGRGLLIGFSQVYLDQAGVAVATLGDWGKRVTTILDLDTTVRTVTENNYVGAFDAQGLSVYLARNGKYGVLARDGRIVAPAVYDAVSPFSEGLAVVQVGDKYGYLDTTGKLAIEPTFDFAADFSEGLAVARVGPYEGGKRGYIGTDGTWVIQPRFDWAYSFQGGVAAVAFGDYDTGTFGYVDRSGNYLWSPSH